MKRSNTSEKPTWNIPIALVVDQAQRLVGVEPLEEGPKFTDVRGNHDILKGTLGENKH